MLFTETARFSPFWLLCKNKQQQQTLQKVQKEACPTHALMQLFCHLTGHKHHPGSFWKTKLLGLPPQILWFGWFGTRPRNLHFLSGGTRHTDGVCKVLVLTVSRQACTWVPCKGGCKKMTAQREKWRRGRVPDQNEACRGNGCGQETPWARVTASLLLLSTLLKSSHWWLTRPKASSERSELPLRRLPPVAPCRPGGV